MEATGCETSVHGDLPPRFEGLGRLMETLVAGGTEAGLAVSVTVDGTPIVDAWCGSAGQQPWTQQTLTTVFSCTKGAVALCAQLLHDRGLLDLDAPVVRYWPEFGAAGKASTLVRHVLAHTAGAVTFPGYWRLLGIDSSGLADWDLMTSGLADSPSSWPAGTRAGYHAVSYGHLVGEVLRRIDGRSIGRFFADEVGEPLGLDFWIGLPDALDDQVTPVLPAVPISSPDVDDETRRLLEMQGMAIAEARRAIRAGEELSDAALPLSSMFVHPDYPTPQRYLAEVFNDKRLRRAEVPGGNGIGTAAALARMYAPLACGGATPDVRLLSAAAVERFNTVESVVPGMAEFCLGYHRWTLTAPEDGPGPATFGHGGAGGSQAFADPARRVSFAIVKNQMTTGPDTPVAVVREIYRCLDS